MTPNMIRAAAARHVDAIAEAAENLPVPPSHQGLRTPDAPVFRRGAAMLLRRERMLVPICLNNGYYTRERIRVVLERAVRSTSQVYVFFTDGPAVHNYLACGETLAGARRECRRHANRLRNHCAAALDLLNAGRDPSDRVHIGLLDWDDIYKSEAYRRNYEYLLVLYQRNNTFRRDTCETTRQVLERKLDTQRLQRLQQIDMQQALKTAVHYSIEELAFLLAFEADALFSGAASACCRTSGPYLYVYYQRWPVFEKLVDGYYDGEERAGIGFHLFGPDVTDRSPSDAI